jgi:hypothetical protein
VISGFGSGIIARELDQKRFSLLGFYATYHRTFPLLPVSGRARARLVLDASDFSARQ